MTDRAEITDPDNITDDRSETFDTTDDEEYDYDGTSDGPGSRTTTITSISQLTQRSGTTKNDFIEEINRIEVSTPTPNQYLEPESSCFVRFVKPSIGLFFAVLSTLAFSLTSLLVKILSVANPMELMTFRSIGILLLSFGICMNYNKNPLGPPGSKVWVFFSGLTGVLSTVAQYYAIRLLPMADATVIIFSAPVVTTILARVFLKEACTVFNVIVICLTLCGVVLIIRPPFLFGDISTKTIDPSDELYGIIAALSANLLIALNFVILRRVKDVHFAVVTLSNGVVGTVICFAATQIVAGNFCIPPCGLDRYLIICMGSLGFLGVMFKALALKYEHAGPVSICRTIEIVCAFLWQVFFFNNVTNALSVGGALLVMGSVVGIGMQKWLFSLPKSSPTRHRFRFLLI